uniref:Uncharacterized protein n=1 Tax=Daucus carota subsp. sativus TaxID=79200 RepID=A0A175YNM5_DAUCS
MTTTTTANNHHETTVPPTIIVEQCSSCNSSKRKPLHHFLDTQQNDHHLSKKPNLSQLYSQFTNIHISSPETLRRAFSAPTSPPMQPFSNPLTPENNTNKSQTVLPRCASDPTPVLGFPVSSPESKIGNSSGNWTVKANTAPLPPRWNPMIRRRRRIEAARQMRRKREETRSQEKVKKMREIIGVTSRWLRRIAQDDQEKEQEQEGSQDTRVVQIPKEGENVGEKCDPETEEEAVSVEKIGECLVLQFKCNCSKTYQILLYGDVCYYKLM